jgi:hypothetical protein
MSVIDGTVWGGEDDGLNPSSRIFNIIMNSMNDDIITINGIKYQKIEDGPSKPKTFVEEIQDRFDGYISKYDTIEDFECLRGWLIKSIIDAIEESLIPNKIENDNRVTTPYTVFVKDPSDYQKGWNACVVQIYENLYGDTNY